MKVRDSGMPEEAYWESFFDPDAALDKLQLFAGVGDVVEFGCGYGTFTIPAARRTAGTVYALDIEPEMTAIVAQKARAAGLASVTTLTCDFVERGTGLPDGVAGYAMLFNILHAARPETLLAEAHRVLRPGGILGVMHWNYDAATPRGPSLAIRPRPEQLREWCAAAGFRALEPGVAELPPYHYGMALERSASV